MSHVLGSQQHPRSVGKKITQLASPLPGSVIRKKGVVVSVQAGPPRTLTITIGADTTQVPGIRFRASYNGGTAPVAGDVVEIDAIGAYHVVLDKLAT